MGSAGFQINAGLRPSACKSQLLLLVAKYVNLFCLCGFGPATLQFTPHSCKSSFGCQESEIKQGLSEHLIAVAMKWQTRSVLCLLGFEKLTSALFGDHLVEGDEEEEEA